jgi:hypothetical protein
MCILSEKMNGDTGRCGKTYVSLFVVESFVHLPHSPFDDIDAVLVIDVVVRSLSGFDAIGLHLSTHVAEK